MNNYRDSAVKGTMINDQLGRSEHVDVGGGRIAYEVVGQGPLVVLSPGMADTRSTYRFLAPLIAAAGYRVASVDLRGHGESSTGWDSYSRTDTAGDLIEVIRKLGGPAVIVGQSFSGGVATIAAATNPELVQRDCGDRPVHPARRHSAWPPCCATPTTTARGALLLGRFLLSGSVKTWSKYLDVAYPGRKPADWDTWLAALQANLREPGRMKAAAEDGAARNRRTPPRSWPTSGARCWWSWGATTRTGRTPRPRPPRSLACCRPAWAGTR